MGLTARPALDNLQFKQSERNVLELSGQTRIFNSSGFTLTDNNGNYVIITATDNGNAGTDGQVMTLKNGKIQLSNPSNDISNRTPTQTIAENILGIGSGGHIACFDESGTTRTIKSSTIHQDSNGNISIHTENSENNALNVNGKTKVVSLETKSIISNGLLELNAMGYNIILSTSGNIGIGKYNPEYKLDITGRIRATDTAYFNHGFVSDTNSTINGKLGINTTEPTTELDINSNKIRIRESYTPESSTATGNKGEWAWDNDFLYVSIDDNNWKRVPLSKW